MPAIISNRLATALRRYQIAVAELEAALAAESSYADEIEVVDLVLMRMDLRSQLDVSTLPQPATLD